MIRALEKGHLSIVQYLLGAGADINEKDINGEYFHLDLYKKSKIDILKDENNNKNTNIFR